MEIKLYFEIIPKEITHIILFNMQTEEDILTLSHIPILSEILDESTFWEQKVKYEFLGVIWNLIPDYLYKYNKTQKLLQHLSRYHVLNTAYNKTVDDLEHYRHDVNTLLRVWEKNIPIDVKKEKYGDKIENYLEQGGLEYLCGLEGINNFDVLNLWYTTKVDDKTELSIKNCWDSSFSGGAYIKIFMVYGKHRFELIDQSDSIITYYVTHQDIFNLLLHVHCSRRGFDITTILLFL